MSTRSLNDLDARIYPKVCELFARCSEIQIPLMIIGVLRTKAEQAENIKKGVSWTMDSKHLPQPPNNKSLAIDVCPYSIFQLHGPDSLMWDANDSSWAKIGQIGKLCGLIWGGNWVQRDMGHFELDV